MEVLVVEIPPVPLIVLVNNIVMKRIFFAIAISLLGLQSIAQNDLDALRYSQTNIGGNARFIAMGGAFGALGANTSCMNYNPAGLGIYRKGEINFTPGLRFTNVTGTMNGHSEKNFNPAFLFSGFGIAGSWDSRINKEGRHSLGLAINQLQNFTSKTSIMGYAHRKSIADDFLASAGHSSPSNLDPSYAGLAFNTYLLDTANGKYYCFASSRFNMLQSKKIETSGRMNEMAVSYAYSHSDKLYLGVSIGIPIVSYNHSAVFTENDDKDSLYLHYNSSTSTFSTSYDTNTAMYYYPGLGGFKSMSYTETYKTSGRGFNLKLGILYRINEYLRVGAHYHTPTILNLTDTYVYKMSARFDEGNTYDWSYPENGGMYKYVIITPMRYGASVGFVYKQWFCLGIDYETLDYGQSQISGSDAGVFSDVNNSIRSKYTRANNIRAGMEFNLNPIMLRLGFASYGSPFGETLSGKFVRNSFSGGFGFRSGNWTFDFGLVKQLYKEDYYMYNPKYADKSEIKFSGTNFVATIGCKF